MWTNTKTFSHLVFLCKEKKKVWEFIMFNHFCSSLAVEIRWLLVCVCEKDGYQTWGWVEEDCPLLLMCDLTSFENGEPRGGVGRGVGV